MACRDGFAAAVVEKLFCVRVLASTWCHSMLRRHRLLRLGSVRPSSDRAGGFVYSDDHIVVLAWGAVPPFMTRHA